MSPAANPALSVLDLVPVRSDQSTGDAVAATLSLARVADEHGYRRYWLAEHHNMPAVAATNPPLLAAMVAGATERLRVGSGGAWLGSITPPEPTRIRSVAAATIAISSGGFVAATAGMLWCSASQ